MRPPGVVAVVPMKPLGRSKSRLAARLAPGEREALSLAMLRRVVGAAVETAPAEVWVVGGDAVVAAAAAELGARWRDDGGADLNQALLDAFRAAHRRGLAAIYLPADLPFITHADIHGILEASGGGATHALAPARRDGGTNAILAPVGSPFRPTLRPGSFLHHKAQAAELDVTLVVHDSPGLAFDLDTPDDLDAYEEMEPGFLKRLTSEGAAASRRGHA